MKKEVCSVNGFCSKDLTGMSDRNIVFEDVKIISDLGRRKTGAHVEKTDQST